MYETVASESLLAHFVSLDYDFLPQLMFSSDVILWFSQYVSIAWFTRYFWADCDGYTVNIIYLYEWECSFFPFILAFSIKTHIFLIFFYIYKWSIQFLLYPINNSQSHGFPYLKSSFVLPKCKRNLCDILLCYICRCKIRKWNEFQWWIWILPKVQTMVQLPVRVPVALEVFFQMEGAQKSCAQTMICHYLLEDAHHCVCLW